MDMSLKNHKTLPWICCMLAALFLSAGLTILSIDNREIANDEILSSEVSYVLDSESEFPVWDTEIAMPPYGETESTSEEGAGILPFAGFGLLAAGGILSVFFLFVMRQKRPYLGPETELFLLSLCIPLIRRFLLNAPVFLGRAVWVFLPSSVRIGILWVLFSAALVCARGILGWLRSGFPLDWSAGHRLGLLLSGSSRKQSRYLLFQFTWSAFTLLFGILLLFFAQQKLFFLLPGISILCATILSLCCSIQRMRDVDHLTDQVRRLHQGTSLSIRDGALRAEEEMLIDLNRQRDEAVRTAVTSERFKVDLISNVSHDLRTPLTAILGYGELLQKERLSADGNMQLAELNRKAGYMRDLVESLFELTKISSGVLESKKENIDLLRLLEQTIGLFDDALKEKNLSVRRHYPSDSLPLLTDGARMHQVFANLIGNAIKYTLPGTRIHLEVKKTAHDCIIRMINIASYEMDFDSSEILQRFVRGDKAQTSEGSGLGLAIAQTYTESVGGTFEVKIDGEQFSAIVTLPEN